MEKIKNVSIIGLGGVGSILSNYVSKYLEHKRDFTTIKLVDGDEYELKNLERQEFNELENKAVAKTKELSSKFKSLHFESMPNFIAAENTKDLDSSDIIFVCVDNHRTRKIIDEYAHSRENVCVISGGNEYTDGNVQVYIRKSNKDVTPSLSDYHPEIDSPADKHPDEMSGEELMNSDPQLLFTNMSVATMMLWSFYNHCIMDNHEKSEVYFDMVSMKADSKARKVKTL